MSCQQQPIIRHWYTDLAGLLFQVKAYSVDKAGISHVVVDYCGGERRILKRHEWLCLMMGRGQSPSRLAEGVVR